MKSKLYHIIGYLLGINLLATVFAVVIVLRSRKLNDPSILFNNSVFDTWLVCLVVIVSLVILGWLIYLYISLTIKLATYKDKEPESTRVQY